MQTAALQTLEIDVTPTLTGSGAYTAGNQVGGIQTLTHACLEQGRGSQLETLTVIDVDNQKAVLELFFFNVNPSVTSSDQAAFAITAAKLKSQCIGRLEVAAANYVTAPSGMAVATLQFTNAFFSTLDPGAHLYVAVATTGTPTYTTASSLVFKYVFARHF